MKESFVFYRSFYESFKDLPDESRLKLYDSLCEMALNGNDFNGLKGIEKSIFTLIKPQIEANYKRYLNGVKGNKSKQKKVLLKHDVNAMVKHDENANVNVNVNDNDNVNENIYGEKITKEKRFIKPTISEIEEYCKERNNGIDPNRFFDFYESKNWFIGKNKVKDWKACVRTWENNRKPQKEELPSWFDKDIQKQEITKEEQDELQKLLEEF